RLAALMLVCLSLPGRADEMLKRLELKDWVTPGFIAAMTISPDGRRVAGVGGSSTTAGFVTDLDTSKSTIIAKWESDTRYLFGSFPIAVSWIGNDLLAVDYSGRESFSVDLTGKRIAKLGERYIRHLAGKGHSSDWVLAYRNMKDSDIDAVN